MNDKYVKKSDVMRKVIEEHYAVHNLAKVSKYIPERGE